MIKLITQPGLLRILPEAKMGDIINLQIALNDWCDKQSNRNSSNKPLNENQRKLPSKDLTHIKTSDMKFDLSSAINSSENGAILRKILDQNLPLTTSTRKILAHAIVTDFVSKGLNMKMKDFTNISLLIEKLFKDDAVSFSLFFF